MSRFGKGFLALLCGTLVIISGCGRTGAVVGRMSADIQPKPIIAKAGDTRSSEEIIEEATAKAATISELPRYQYPDKDSIQYEIYRYLIDGLGSQYDPADVCVPLAAIIAIDDSNNDDILIYGDFWIYNYDLDGDTLKTASGGNYPGVIHVKKNKDGYETLSFDVVEDGSGWDASAKKIFGKHYDDFMKIYSDNIAIENMRRQILADYVLENKLSINQYQDYGWDPVSLEFDEDTEG